MIKIRILIDENLSHPLADGLNSLQKPLNDEHYDIEVVSIHGEFGTGIKDEDWIPKWGKQKGIFITEDSHIIRNPSQLDLLLKNGLGAFILKPPKGSRYWDKVELIIKNWQMITDICKRKNKPYAYSITKRAGVKKVSV